MKRAFFGFCLVFMFAVLFLGCGNSRRAYFIPTVAPITTLTVGGTVSGSIDGAGDIDWFAVELEAGKGYKFCTSNLSGGMDTYLRFISPDRSIVLAENDNVGDALNSCIEFCVDTDGVYFLMVTHVDPEAIMGMYDLSAELLGDCEPDDDDGEHHGHHRHHRHHEHHSVD